jgi:hypothetical protein
MTFQKGNKINVGRKCSEEKKKKIGDKNRGKVRTQESIEKQREKRIGKKYSTETKLKMSLAHIGLNVWTKGTKWTEERKNSQSFARSDEKSPRWKGEDVGYNGLHIWIRKVLGKAKKCSKCGKEGTGREIHWANKDHLYKREPSEFMELCLQCHATYDKENNLRKHNK